MIKSRKTDQILLSAILTAVPLAYWPGLKDYTLGPKLLVWQIPLLLLLSSRTVRDASLPRHPIITMAVGYLLINALSIFWSTDPVLGLLELSKIATGVVFLCVLATMPAGQVPSLIKVLVGTGLFVALVGILQHLNLFPWGIPSAGMPSSTLGFRNIAAMLAIQTLPFAIWLAWVERKRPWLWTTSVSLLSAFLIHTKTRGAWIGILAAFAFTAVMNRREILSFLLGRRTLVAALAVGLLIGLLPGRLDKIGPQSIDEKKSTVSEAVASILTPGGDRGRVRLWERTLTMISANPFLGVGLGNWATEYPTHDDGNLITYNSAPSRPHNDWLWITSELGLLGLAAFIGMIFVGWKAGYGAQVPPAAKPLLIATIGSVLAILVHSSFSFPRERITPTLLFWFSLGVIAALTPRGKSRIAGQISWGVATSGAILLIAFTSSVIAFERKMFDTLQPERLGDWKQVEIKSGEALERGRFHPEAIQLRGYALNQLGRYSESVSHYARYESARPYDVQFLNGYAIALQQTNQLAKARRMFERARALVADSTDLDYNLAMLLIQMKHPNEALQLLEGVLEREQPTAALLFHLGNARALAGDDIEAVQALESALQLEPRLAQAQFVLGELYLRLRRPSAARSAFRAFLRETNSPNPYTKRAQQVLEQLSPEESPFNE